MTTAQALVPFTLYRVFLDFSPTWCGILFVDIDAIDRCAAHVSWQVNVDGGHDAEDDARLKDSDEVGGALALVLGHEVFPGLTYLK